MASSAEFTVYWTDQNGMTVDELLDGWFRVHESGVLAVMPEGDRGIQLYAPGVWTKVNVESSSQAHVAPDVFDCWPE